MSGVVKTVIGVALVLVAAVSVALTFGGSAAWAIPLAKAGFALAGMGLLEEASKLFLPSIPKTHVRQDVEYTGTVTPSRIIYGTMKVAGLNIIRPLVTGSDGKYLHQVMVLARHPCSAISKVFFNETELSTFTAVTGNPSDGLITTGNYDDLAWVRRYLGTQTVVDFILNAAAPAFWPSTHVGNGVTYLALTYKLSEKRYANGKPDITALVDGKKCYDPRLDTSPGAHPTDAGYKVFTLNPALQLADYLTDDNLGRGVDENAIDWSLVVAAANICDETVDIPTASTQTRYTQSLVLDAAGSDDIHRTNIQALASGMMGVCYRQGGVWRMYAGAALSPGFALTERDIVGDVSVRMETPLGDKYNFVRGTFRDSSRNYQEVEFEPRGNGAYEAEDNNTRLPKAVSFAGVTNAYEAQRNAIIVLRRSRMRQTLTTRFSLAAYSVRPFIVGTMTFADIGWSAKRVVCTSWQFMGDGTIEMTLQEDDSTIWSDPAEINYTAPGSGLSGTSASYVPDPCSGLVGTPLVGGVRLNWNLPLAMLSGDVIELWEDDSSDPFAGAKVWEGRSDSALLPKNDETVRYYGLRVRAENDNFSSTEPPTGGVTVAAVDDGTFIIYDEYFSKSTTNGDYWDWGAGTGISITLTGGVTGGVLTLVGNSTVKSIISVRVPPHRAVTGTQFSLTYRFRRTSTLTGTGGSVALQLWGVSSPDGLSGGVNMSITGTDIITMTAMNAYTVNQWQEERIVLTMQNNPKSSAQQPYAIFGIAQSAFITGGTVEVDCVVVNPI